MLTKRQIQVSNDVDTLLDTTADFLCFVTEFFEVIGQSVPHIYQSALLLAPWSSVVWRLYRLYVSLPDLRAITGMAASWRFCTWGTGARTEINHAVWSPDGQLIAVGWVDRVKLRDPNTLKTVSIFKPPSSPSRMAVTPQSLAFSPDGRTLACAFHR